MLERTNQHLEAVDLVRLEPQKLYLERGLEGSGYAIGQNSRLGALDRDNC